VLEVSRFLSNRPVDGPTFFISSQGSVVGIVTGLGAGFPGFESGQGIRLFSSLKRPGPPWGPASLLFEGYWSSVLVLKRPCV
jgi:hypothetical protein